MGDSRVHVGHGAGVFQTFYSVIIYEACSIDVHCCDIIAVSGKGTFWAVEEAPSFVNEQVVWSENFRSLSCAPGAMARGVPRADLLEHDPFFLAFVVEEESYFSSEPFG